MRRVDRAQVRLAADANARLVRFQHPVVLFTEPERAVVGHLGVQTRAVSGQCRDMQGAAARPVTIDAFLLDDALDLVDRREHRALHRDRGVAAMVAHGSLARAREERRAPPAVATRAAEPDVFALADGDSERRIGREQRVRGPQAGVAGADDRNVGIDVAGKW